MWRLIEHPGDDASDPRDDSARIDTHLASIPACAALGVRRAVGDRRVMALCIDTDLAAVRTNDGGVDAAAGYLLADQAAANGIFAVLERPVPMMTLGLRVDWMARLQAGALTCAIDDVIREGDTAVVRGTLATNGTLAGTLAARFLLGTMPGGHRDDPTFGDVAPPSAAQSFDAYLDVEALAAGCRIAPRWELVGARPLPAYHGGVIAALIERTACKVTGSGFRVLDMEVGFLAPGRADQPLNAVAQPRRLGRRAAWIDVTAYHDDPARPVAIGRVTAISDDFEAATAYRLS